MSDLKAPCLVQKKLKDGTILYYWEVTKTARDMGYQPQTRRLHGEADEILSLCRIYTAEMREWMDIQNGAIRPGQCLNIAGLFRQYRTRPESPFNCRVKANTKKTYSASLDWIENRIGSVTLNEINLAILRRWYNEARWPEGPDGVERLHTAYRVIEMLRRVLSFGVAAEIDGCDRIHAILSNTQFERPKPRASSMTREQAETFVSKAIELGRPSLAIATAIQFECAFRQKDVIGEWLPIPSKGASSNYTLNRNQWLNGLTWADIDLNWQINKTTTKTGQVVSHDLTLTDMAIKLLRNVPEDQRIGPLIIDERSGRPYADKTYTHQFRLIANAAGLPKDVWSMDCRSGAATEASEAGGSLDDIRETMGHSDAKTTLRYIRGKKLAQSRRIAELRLAVRNG